MSETRESPWASDAVEPSERDAVVPPEARAEIEAVLSAFRQWLLESEQWRTAIAVPTDDAPRAGAAVDLHALVAEWIALKQEVRLEARGSKSARQELDQAVEAFREGVGEAGEAAQKLLERLVAERDHLRDEAQSRLEAQQGEWVAVLLDVRDALARGADSAGQARRRLGWRRRLLPGGLLDGLLEGYALGLRRIDAALEGREIRPIECADQRVDPERMRVVDVVRRDDLPEGQVVEVLRPGYVCGSRVIRYAEVRAAAKTSQSAQPQQDSDEDS